MTYIKTRPAPELDQDWDDKAPLKEHSFLQSLKRPAITGDDGFLPQETPTWVFAVAIAFVLAIIFVAGIFAAKVHAACLQESPAEMCVTN